MELIVMIFGLFGVGFMLGVIITKIASNNNKETKSRTKEIKVKQ